MVKRLLIAAALLAMIHGVVLALRRERWPSEIAPPEVDLAQIPYKLDYKLDLWTGEDAAPDPEIFKALKADEVLDRIYRSNVAGEAVLLHVSNYCSLVERWAPHPPDVCYARAGWRLEEQRDKMLKLGEGRSVRARLDTFEQKGQRILVLFWYHFGDEIVLDHGELRSARWKLIGKRTWPAITKFMLQIPAVNREQAEERITRFAQILLDRVMKNPRRAAEPAGEA